METEVIDITETVLVKADPSELCRLCANTDNQLMPIFKGEGSEHSIPDKIEKYLPFIKVSDVDKLPLQICYQCASTLIMWHSLYEGCTVADRKLRELLSLDEKMCQEEDDYVQYIDDCHEEYDEEQTQSDLNMQVETESNVTGFAAEEALPNDVEVIQLNEPQIYTEATDKRSWKRKTDIRDDDSAEKAVMLRDCHPKKDAENGSVIINTSENSVRNTSRNRALPVEIPSSLLSLPLSFQHYKCASCRKVFLKEHNYLRHVRRHIQSNETPHQDEPEPRQTATLKGDLLKCAEKVMINGRPFLKCSACSFVCKSANAAFAKHLKMHNYQYCWYAFSCEMCGQRFREKQSLSKHISRQHENTREFACDFCERMFFDRHHLLQHSRTHTGEKPYVCEMCGKCFAQLSSLSTHKKFHTGEKKHICQLCGKGFVTNSGLLVHIRRHTGERSHICSRCGKTFVSTSQLKSHMLVHYDDKPFSCSDCGAEFKSKRYLKTHCGLHVNTKK